MTAWNQRSLPTALCGAALLLAAAGTLPARADGTLSVEGVRIDVRVSAESELVFDSARDGCDADDIPDIPMRMVRRADGQVIGFGSHYTTRAFTVRKNGDMKRDCAIVMRSERNPDPARFSDMTWLSTPWSADGKTIYAFSDNEYHAHKHPGECQFNTYQQCWFNSIVIAVSKDGGKSFKVPAGMKPIAAANFDHKKLQGEPRGFFTPTNLVEKNGYYYSIIFTTGGEGQPRGQCLFRTGNPGDPAAWQFWTGKEFVPSAHDPVAGEKTAAPCQPLSIGAERVQTLLLHKPSGLFLLTGGRRTTGEGPGGAYLFASRDLVNWSKGVLLAKGSSRQEKDCGAGFMLTYPSLVDLKSDNRNFTTVGDSAFLYATRVNLRNTGNSCESSRARQLVRYSVKLTMP